MSTIEGSIVKRGKTYTVVIPTGTDPATGKKTQKWYGGYKTKKDAEKARTEFLYKFERGELSMGNEKLLLKDFLEKWIYYHRDNIREATDESYSGYIINHIIPALGYSKVKDIKPITIQDFYKDLKKKISPKTNKPLSAKTIHNIHEMLHVAFEQAKKWKIVYENIMDDVDPPKIETEEAKFLEEDESAKLLNFIKGEPCYIGILLALTAGMRRGEIMGLEWKHIDFKDGCIFVKQQRTRYGIGPLKTKSGKRYIVLFDYVIEELLVEKERQDKILKEFVEKSKEEKIDISELIQINDYVCKWDDGVPFHVDFLTHKLPKLLKKFDMTKVKLHELRHSHLTDMAFKGMPGMILSKRAGHSNEEITEKVYLHLSKKMQKEALKQISNSTTTNEY